MGVSFLFANLDKRQYFSPWTLGDGGSLSRYFKGDHVLVLAMLVCDSGLVKSELTEPPAGSWQGDRVVAVMDCAEPNELGIATATDDEPDRNLYMMCWQEFEDVSYDAIAMLCNWSPKAADRLAKVAAETLAQGQPLRLLHLGRALSKVPCRPLQRTLEREIGMNWPELYQEVERSHQGDDRG